LGESVRSGRNVRLGSGKDDVNAYIYAEYLALSEMASLLAYTDKAELYKNKAEDLKARIIKHLYHADENMFWNRRRDGRIVIRNAFSNYIPLTFGILDEERGRALLKDHLMDRKMLSRYGVRSLAQDDPDYNNECMIVPYSNWQGPVWVVANYLHTVALNCYGLKE
jgi:alpha,alpha-trehalase